VSQRAASDVDAASARLLSVLRQVDDPLSLLVGIFFHSPVAFQVYRKDGHCLLTNPAFRRLFGSEPPPEYNILRDELAQRNGLLDLVHRAFAGETILGPPLWYDPRELTQVNVTEGNRVAIESTFFPLRDREGTVQYIAIVFKDITAERTLREEAERERDRLAAAERARAQSDREREEALRVAEAANLAKDEFLAMLGHELRNPLSPIVTALSLMKLKSGDGSTREQQVIERQVEHLTRLVDDLLDVSRITRGKIELKKAPIDLGVVVGQALEMASPLFEQRRHALDVSVEPGLQLEADAGRLAQVLSNLLTNAAKYTEPEGRIELRAHRDGPDIVLSVKDNGAGIAPELLPSVFDLFVQGKRSASGGVHGGLGIGLTLVRSLVALHGGTVVAKSGGRGQGSEFIVRLPAREARRPEGALATSDKELTRSPRPMRILVVDDNEDAAVGVAELLRVMGHEVAVAYDGPRALRAVEGFRPDVAILDIGLPVMDGYELARRLREVLGSEAPHLIALTGYGQEHDRLRSFEAGFEAHLVKPVAPEVLLSHIEQTV
jgi:signal transduction histidine kinase